jgi:small subunit ribosomal protein S20
VANTKSAQKRIRVTLRRTMENRRRRTFVRTAIRRFERLLQAGDRDGASQALRNVYRALDRAAQKGTIHRNRAARKKARLARRLAASAG